MVLWVGLAHSAPFLGGRRTLVLSPVSFFGSSRTSVVIFLFIPKVVVKFLPIIKVVNIL